MIYSSIPGVKLRAFKYGGDLVPDWFRNAKREVLFGEVKLYQPEDNKDLACGFEYVIPGNFVVFTEGGSFQVYSPEHFYKILISKDMEPGND